MCLLDAGRLMAAPLGDRTRLDAALDAVPRWRAVADELGDRCGVVAFDAATSAAAPPRRARRRRGRRARCSTSSRATVDSDYELAFARVGGAKRALVIVFTDLLDDAAARPLLDAVPVLTRRHAVVVGERARRPIDSAAGARRPTREASTPWPRPSTPSTCGRPPWPT